MTPRSNLEQKIIDFEQAVREQIFDAAEYLLQRTPPLNLAALRLLVSYFEPIAKYADGYAKSGSSKRYFVKGCIDVMSISRRNRSDRAPTNEQLEGFYEIVRCGLAHSATLSSNVAIGAGPYAFSISTDGSRLSVNPRELLTLLHAHLSSYAAKLRDPIEATVRQHFESRWDFEASI